MSIGSYLLYVGVLLAAPDLPPHGDGRPGGPVELAPFPRPVGPPVQLTVIPGGYQIRMNRWATEQVQAALGQADPKEIATLLADRAKDKRDGADADPDAAAKLDLAAFLVVTQLPGFQKAMRENAGPGGVVITVTGAQAAAAPLMPDRPRLNRLAGLVEKAMPLLPPDARDAVGALRAMARTTPQAWKVEPLP